MNSRSTRGFTLIEVVVVLVLLGIVAGVTVPAFRNTALGGPRAAVTGEVLRLLEGARSTALDRAAVTRLMLDPRTGNYQIEGDSVGYRVSIREGRLSLPAGVRLEGGAGWLVARFTPTGTAVTDTIAVTGPDGTTRISVDRWTGVPRAQ